MKTGSLRLLAAAALAIVLAACGSSPTAPSIVVSGSWFGSVTDTVNGEIPTVLVISQVGSNLSGSWAMGVSTGLSGTFSGITTSDSMISLTLQPAFGSPLGVCLATLGASYTVTGGTSNLSGGYSANPPGCATPFTGTITLSKSTGS